VCRRNKSLGETAQLLSFQLQLDSERMPDLVKVVEVFAFRPSAAVAGGECDSPN
jgi:hypothetical protein